MKRVHNVFLWGHTRPGGFFCDRGKTGTLMVWYPKAVACCCYASTAYCVSAQYAHHSFLCSNPRGFWLVYGLSGFGYALALQVQQYTPHSPLNPPRCMGRE